MLKKPLLILLIIQLCIAICMADDYLPSQEFDFTDLYAPNVICRYAPSVGDTTCYPDKYREIGIMSGDPLDPGTHINVVHAPSFCSIFSDIDLSETPPNEDVSIRLGNYYSMTGVEDVEYTIRVDSTRDPIVIFRFMPVLMESHKNGAGAAFAILDEKGKKIDSLCMSFRFSLEGSEVQGTIPGNPEWQKYEQMYKQLDGTFKLTKFQYLDWPSIGLDLSPYHGQVLTIRVQNFDCKETQHFGFCCFTLKTRPKRIMVDACEDGKMKLTAPEGFFYRWYDASNMSTILSTNQVFEVYPPYANRYVCQLSANESFACHSQISVEGDIPIPVSDFTYDIHHGICADTIFFTNTSFASPDGIHPFEQPRICDSAKWSFDEGIYLANNTSYSNDYHLSQPVIFTKSGDFKIQLATCITNWECSSDTIVKTIHVDREQEKILYDTTCYGTPVLINEERIQTTIGDTIITRDVVDPECGLTLPYKYYIHTNPSYLIHEQQFFCDSSGAVWHGQKIKMQGLYTDTMLSLSGCDSIIMLHAFFEDTAVIKEQGFLCKSGDSFEWYGKLYYQEGTYRDTLPTERGCKRVHELKLMKGSTTFASRSYEVCKGYSVTIYGKMYSKAGTFLDTLVNASGCDSIVTITITEKDCTQPGEWGDHPLNPYIGCDTAYSTTYRQIYEKELPTFQWNGIPMNRIPHNDQRDTTLVAPLIKTDLSCDSIATLHLHVLFPCELPATYQPVYYRKE